MALRADPKGIALAVLVSSFVGAALGCGRPRGDDSTPIKAGDADIEAIEDGPRRARERPKPWLAKPPAIPPPFAAFPKPALDRLLGVWLVPSDVGDGREIWIVDEGGRRLTIVDARGRERVHGLALLSPCAVRLLDGAGRKRERTLAFVGDTPHISTAGSFAVEAEGALLVCQGSKTFTIDAEGVCTAHSEMLGVWETAPVDAAECTRGEGTLTVAGVELEARDGLWLDAVSEAAAAERFADRASAEAALAAKADSTGTDTADETATDTGSETGAGTSQRPETDTASDTSG